ncbi:MAG: hypothetical protein ACOZBW_12680 [Thermodesulfobacteriota bacterium]
MGAFKYYVPGLLLIAGAFLIIAFPQILVAIVAALVLMSGITALALGNMMKNYERELKNRGEGGFVEMFFGRRNRW